MCQYSSIVCQFLIIQLGQTKRPTPALSQVTPNNVLELPCYIVRGYPIHCLLTAPHLGAMWRHCTKPGNRIRNTRLFGRLQCLFRYSVDDKNPNIIFGSFCRFCIVITENGFLLPNSWQEVARLCLTGDNVNKLLFLSNTLNKLKSKEQRVNFTQDYNW